MKEENKEHTYGFFRVLGGTIIGTFVAALFALVIGVLIMVLWNWLMPELFGLGVITYWQGFGIALLARLLFGGMGHKEYHEKKDHMYSTKHKYVKHMRRSPRKTGWFDEVYEKWWEDEGAERFEEYMKKEADDKQE